MRINGEARIGAPLDRVWWALNDPAVLVRTIPGCQRLEETGPDAYHMTVTAGVAPIQGTYDGEVLISVQQAPTTLVLRASGAGGSGSVRADVRVRLAADGSAGTRVSYDAEATVGGMLGGVRQRVLATLARRTAGQFLRNVEDVLTGKAVAHVPPSGAIVPERSAGRARALPSPGGLPRPPQLPPGFSNGAIVGAAGALTGVAIGWLIGRRR